ncbi:NRAMP (natural resistance-associated macrophage protein) metal ion transporters [Salinimicrobium catena]|uniref:NRAMP (Natural resistance-associated macrophage protein) metal ion transporters n=1 Tax=Salinimicrobium catena TaxID=390640 RepID=A0A1H5LE56_9FLAO|nr:Nramp family divalent metal transporter [Salinimicrobium catena]SDL09020.1 NRAMP (natural resistance-associated macrophage protein) metal ion transporters [Salinimicrobium catena]SEE75284.1 NRAMP (natural resistance-associated macrophage protein) metal ion transporters [Salinimicrobium catena]
MRNWLKNVGPGVLVSAAFIGPGTVTVCTLAGVDFGFSLLWALLLSIIACIVLQEMAARLGIITGRGLSEVIREEVKNPIFKWLSIILIFAAIVLGNAAYEAGNITGAVLGMSAVVPSPVLEIGAISLDLWSLVIGLIAFILLAIGNYKILEKVFIALVAIMSISFVVTAVMTRPEVIPLLKGLFIPKSGSAGLLTVMALIGTTVVPYNLFLHASLVGEKWKGQQALKIARKELFWAILLGGVVSMSIVITAAASGITSVTTAADFAAGLEPLFGSYATFFIALGLFAAGISSSITAPLAAAYVVRGCLGWKKGLNSIKFKMVWAGVLLLGVFFSSLGLKPVEIIQFAQVANGILLPVVAIFLFWIVNRASVMGEHKNSVLQNVLGTLIIAVTIFLGAKSIYTVLEGI